MVFTKGLVLPTILLICFINLVHCDSENMTSDNTNITEGRTFGHHFLKRISFAILPAAFVVGVITTLLAALTVVSVKGLGVGVILLILAIGQLLSRSLVQTHAAAAYAAPVPVVYSHHKDYSPSPVWLEKDW